MKDSVPFRIIMPAAVPKIYCVKCHAKTMNGAIRRTKTSMGQPMIKTKCQKCGSTKCRFVARK